ncbi:hypothetical protein NL676_002022, partial [Syzygium grande]
MLAKRTEKDQGEQSLREKVRNGTGAAPPRHCRSTASPSALIKVTALEPRLPTSPTLPFSCIEYKDMFLFPPQYESEGRHASLSLNAALHDANTPSFSSMAMGNNRDCLVR